MEQFKHSKTNYTYVRYPIIIYTFIVIKYITKYVFIVVFDNNNFNLNNYYNS